MMRRAMATLFVLAAAVMVPRALQAAYIDEYTFTIPNSAALGTEGDPIDPGVGTYVPEGPAWGGYYLLLPQFNRPGKELTSVEFILTGDITGNTVSVTNNGGSNNSFTISVDTVITLAYADTTTITDATPTFTGTTVGLAPNATHVFNNVSATDEGTYTELSDFSRFTSDDVSLVVNSASITPLSLDGKNPIIGPDILSQATVTVRYTSIPEPGGIMLSLTALLIGLVRRRRRA